MSAFRTYGHDINWLEWNVPSVGARDSDGADEMVGDGVGYGVFFLLLEDMEDIPFPLLFLLL